MQNAADTYLIYKKSFPRFFTTFERQTPAIYHENDSTVRRLLAAFAAQQGDAPAIFGAIDTQREHLGRWLPFVAATHRVEQTQEVVAGMLNDTANPVFTIRGGDAFAGLIGFKSADSTTRTIEIGYWLRSEFQGRGIMTSAVQALCRLAFEEMGMERIEIRCALGNYRSNRIPQRLGFALDRVEVRGERLADGEFVDLNVYLLER